MPQKTIKKIQTNWITMRERSLLWHFLTKYLNSILKSHRKQKTDWITMKDNWHLNTQFEKFKNINRTNAKSINFTPE